MKNLLQLIKYGFKLGGFVGAMMALSFALPFQGYSGSWLVVEIGAISPASTDILEGALSDLANQEQGLLILLDTPGGVLDSTRDMVKAIMNADKPVAVWVGPNGGRAASAGAFIGVGAHFLLMAEGTNIGAAHPIQASGADIEESDAGTKLQNDTIAFMESIASARGRNKELAASFVTESVSISGKQAVDNNIADGLAGSPLGAIKLIQNRSYELSTGQKGLISGGQITLRYYQLSLRQKLLEILCNPNLFYLLFLAGLIGIGFELTHPGVMVPGVVGSICLLLALISSSVLPISFGALLLCLAGLAFMVAELFVPSFGVLGLGGFAAFVTGSFMLVDPSSGLQISAWTILPGSALIALVMGLVGYLVVKAERLRVMSGVSGMVGLEGEVIENVDAQQGLIRLSGELWQARTSEPVIAKGSKVMVVKVEGLIAYVTHKEKEKDL